MGSCFHAVSGIVSYCDRYSDGMKRVLKTFGPVPEFSGATAEKVNQVCGLFQGKLGMQAGAHCPPPSRAACGRGFVSSRSLDPWFFLTTHSCILVPRMPKVGSSF